MSTPAVDVSFSRLPTELRLMIWEAALPDTTGKHLYFWRNHVWRKPRWKLQTDPTTNQEYVKFEFDSRSFGYLEVEVPPFLVNREAHAVALRWIEKQPKIEIRFNTATMSFSFIRLFDPNHDALYLSSQDYLDLPSEIYEGSDAPGHLELGNRIHHIESFSHIAVPKAEVFSEKFNFLDSVIDIGGSSCCRQFSVVVNELSTSQPLTKDMNLHERWELTELQDSPLLFWDPDNDTWILTRSAAHENLNQDLLRARECLISFMRSEMPPWELEEWNRIHKHRLLIKPVLAVKR